MYASWKFSLKVAMDQWDASSLIYSCCQGGIKRNEKWHLWQAKRIVTVWTKESPLKWAGRHFCWQTQRIGKFPTFTVDWKRGSEHCFSKKKKRLRKRIHRSVPIILRKLSPSTVIYFNFWSAVFRHFHGLYRTRCQMDSSLLWDVHLRLESLKSDCHLDGEENLAWSFLRRFKDNLCSYWFQIRWVGKKSKC